MTYRYDETDLRSIEEFSKELIGKTFNDVLRENITDDDLYKLKRDKFNNPRGKGSLGELIEEHHFGLEVNNEARPDFYQAGVELKVTPYEQNKNGSYRAGERLTIGMIPNSSPIPESFYSSKLASKIEHILLVLYLRNREIDRIDYQIDYAHLLSFGSELLKADLEIIKQDYEIITQKIKSGLAHELSESDTMYLGAATKGASAKRSLQPQYYNPDIPAKRRAFSFKQSYMTSIINNYIFKDTQTTDNIVDDPVNISEFQQIIKDRILKYEGQKMDDLMDLYGVGRTAKNKYSLLIYKMLGIKSNQAEEFLKSNTQLKTIRIKENGELPEHMSFPIINLIDFVQSDWEDSQIFNFFDETRFLFIVIQENKGSDYLADVIFWNMPRRDLDEIAYRDWKSYVEEINKGVTFEKKGNRIENSLPTSKNTKIIHLRPKARSSAYKIDGKTIGNIERDADLLPNGDMMTKQAFWLNKEYILEEILNKYYER